MDLVQIVIEKWATQRLLGVIGDTFVTGNGDLENEKEAYLAFLLEKVKNLKYGRTP